MSLRDARILLFAMTLLSFQARGEELDGTSNLTREPASVVPMAADSAKVSESEANRPKFEFSGYVDFGSQWDSAGGATVGGRSFGSKAGFMLLNSAELTFKGTRGPLSTRIDFAAGENVDVLTPFDKTASANENLRYITQAYLSYSLSELEGWSVNAGKMYTHMGYELTRAKDNWVYTRGFLFSYAIPFWHQGVSMTGPVVKDLLSAGLFVYNGWDGRTSAEQNRSVTVGGNLAFTGSSAAVLSYNYIGGPEQADPSSRRDVHELIAGYNGQDFGLVVDVVSGQEIAGSSPASVSGRWNALAVYSRVAVDDRTRFVGRYEMFDDRDSGFAVSGALAGAGAARQYQSTTLGLNRDLSGGLELRFEWRKDYADQDSTLFKDSSGGVTSHQDTFNLGFLLSM